MPKILAFAGKGGVGKTTIGGMLIRYLVEEVKGGPVLAVDADPNSNLNEVLGVPVANTIGEARELMKKDVPAGMHKRRLVRIQGKRGHRGVKGLRPPCHGKARRPRLLLRGEQPRQEIHRHPERQLRLRVVVDNEAGMEHMSRLVTQDVDHLFVISDAQPRGLLTAKRIIELAGELKLNIKNTHLLINRLREEDRETMTEVVLEKGLDVRGTIRDDREILRADAAGKTVFDLDASSAALSDAYRIFAKTAAT